MTVRDNQFQHLVLSGLYCCVWLLCRVILKQGGAGCGYFGPATNFRINCIAFGDEHGAQTEHSETYRRDTTYPKLPEFAP